MEEKIENALMAMGVPANISGFNYIKEAVLIRERDGTDAKWMGVYAEIAKKYGKTASKVERGIRYAFEVARCTNGDYDAVNHYIGFINTSNVSSLCHLHQVIKNEAGKDSNINVIKDKTAISEDWVRQIVRETIKEMLGEIA